jgi:aspartoacylase
MVHPEIQDRHYPLLHPGDPLFLTFDGETLPYEGPEPRHAVFINEAAYYEKGFAMALARKRVVTIPSG